MENKKIVNFLRSLADILDTSEGNEIIETIGSKSEIKTNSDLIDNKILVEASKMVKIMEAVDNKFKDKNPTNLTIDKVVKFKEDSMKDFKSELIKDREDFSVITKDLPG